MDAYTGFAAVYDELMDNIPYEEWGKYLIDLLNEYGIKDGIVLDVAQEILQRFLQIMAMI